MDLKTNAKPDKDTLNKVRNLSDEDLWEIVKVFDFCVECWKHQPEKCELKPIREKVGLTECRLFQLREYRRKVLHKSKYNKERRTKRKD